jgi:hypothetical protein
MLGAIALAFASTCWSQAQSDQLSARELFYREKPDQDKIVPASRPEKPDPTKGRTKATADKGGKQTKPVASTSTVPPVEHLGIRYNVLVVDSVGEGQATDPDRMFDPGENISFEFLPNRSGYLYVFNRGSGGEWQILFPSIELLNQSNFIKAQTRVRVPEKPFALEIEGVRGTERVFVVLTRNPEDVTDLSDSIRKASPGGEPSRPQQPPKGPQTIERSKELGSVIDKMEERLSARELRIVKVPQAQDRADPPNSVFIVNGSKTPLDHIEVEIRINHR